MANNEAKIKFTAETGEFNKAIGRANDELGLLRSELKLNEKQMQNNGKSVEALEKQHSLLENQLKASQAKTEALSQKVQKAVEIFGENSKEATKLKTQLANAQSAEENIRKAISKCNTEIEEQASAEKEAARATSTLTDKIDAQQSELTQLKKKYADLVIEGKENTDEAKRLARQINDLSGELKQSKTAFDDAADKADKLDRSMEEAGDGAEQMGDGFTVAKGIIADLASNVIQGCINKVGELVGAMLELPEATRELRQDFATLETSYESMGFSNEQATDTWKDLYKIFGEDDRAVEAANLISKMAKNQEDLNDWVTITQGVWGSYQDSLPVEGLAESSNETAKTGKVTGVLADALNWSSEASKKFAKYMGEDVTTAEDAFNVALAECTTEQERQALITNTLKDLYGDAAKKYEEASGQQMAAKEATAENTLVQAEMADTVEPLTTAWQGYKTELLVGVMPAIKTFTDLGIKAIAWMKEHPQIVKALCAVLLTLATVVSAVFTVIVPLVTTLSSFASSAGGWGALFAKIGAAFKSIGGAAAGVSGPIGWIVVAVVACIAAFVSLWKNSEDFRTKMKSIWGELKGVFGSFVQDIVQRMQDLIAKLQPLFNFLKILWTGFCDLMKPVFVATFGFIVDTIRSALNFILGIVDIFIGVFTGDWEQVWTGVKEIFTSIWQSIAAVFEFTWTVIKGTLEAIIGWFGGTWDGFWNGVKNLFVNTWNAITGFLSVAWEKIKSVVQVGIMFLGSLISGAVSIITLPFRFIWENCKQYVFAAWEWIKSKVTTGINAVKNVISTVMNAIKRVFSTVWNAIKNALTPVLNSIKNTITNVFNAIKSKITSIWNGVKSFTISAWNNIKSRVSSVVNSVKNSVSNAFNNIKSTATSVWNSVKSAITTPIEAAKNKVKSSLDAIKGFFNRLKLKFPNIKLPHFSISGKFSLSPPSVPKLKIDWYKDGGIMTKPTIFGMNGMRFMGGGEAGYEAILPIAKLQTYITEALERKMQATDLTPLVNAIEDLADRAINLNVNGRRFATATASDTDNVGGLRNSFKSRGLAID